MAIFPQINRKIPPDLLHSSFAAVIQTPRFGVSHPAGLDEDTSTWTGQEEYSSSSSFTANKNSKSQGPPDSPPHQKKTRNLWGKITMLKAQAMEVIFLFNLEDFFSFQTFRDFQGV